MGVFFAPLMAALGNLVKGQIGFWIMSALAAFGLQLAAQEFAVEPILNQIQAQSGGLGEGLAWFRYLGCDQFITTILSAYATAAAFSSIRLVKKP